MDGGKTTNSIEAVHMGRRRGGTWRKKKTAGKGKEMLELYNKRSNLKKKSAAAGGKKRANRTEKTLPARGGRKEYMERGSTCRREQ